MKQEQIAQVKQWADENIPGFNEQEIEILCAGNVGIRNGGIAFSGEFVDITMPQFPNVDWEKTVPGWNALPEDMKQNILQEMYSLYHHAVATMCIRTRTLYDGKPEDIVKEH